MDTEKFIRDCAARNMSQNETRKTLGWTRWRWKKVLSVLPDVKWPARGASITAKRAQEARRGVPVPSLVTAREVRRTAALRTVRGHVGTIEELCAHFGQVSASRARARIHLGMTVEQAVTTPRQPSGRGNRMKIAEVQPC